MAYNTSPGSGYSKRPLWQWIIIYVVAAIIVYGLVYYFFFAKNNTSYSSSTNQTTQTSSPMIPAMNIAVTINGYAFSPSDITVKQGATVTWTNQDSVAHTVTGNNGGPSSQQIPHGGTYSYTFNTVGTFAYHCSIHPDMTGIITVTQ
jgi:plastocyanin